MARVSPGATAASGAYAKISFPPYEFREFPKMITLPDGRVVKVKSQYEEIVARNEAPSGAPSGAPNPVVEENAALRAQMQQLQEQMARLLQSQEDTAKGKPQGSAKEGQFPITPESHISKDARVAGPQIAQPQGERARDLANAGGVPQTGTGAVSNPAVPIDETASPGNAIASMLGGGSAAGSASLPASKK